VKDKIIKDRIPSGTIQCKQMMDLHLYCKAGLRAYDSQIPPRFNFYKRFCFEFFTARPAFISRIQIGRLRARR
jgi:hypothetical protein